MRLDKYLKVSRLVKRRTVANELCDVLKLFFVVENALVNPEKEIAVEMCYDVKDFPVTLEWKSMISGDYALGIEPSLTRFDKFQMRKLQPSEQKTYEIKINFQ